MRGAEVTNTIGAPVITGDKGTNLELRIPITCGHVCWTTARNTMLFHTCILSWDRVYDHLVSIPLYLLFITFIYGNSREFQRQPSYSSLPGYPYFSKGKIRSG